MICPYERIGIGMLLIPMMIQMVATTKRTPENRKICCWIFAMLGIFEFEGILLLENILKIPHLTTFMLVFGYILCIIGGSILIFVWAVSIDVKRGRIKGVVIDEEKKRYSIQQCIVLMITGVIHIGLYYLINAFV